jgi:hypothetical protein
MVADEGKAAQLHLPRSGHVEIDHLPNGVFGEKNAGFDTRIERLLHVLCRGLELLLRARSTVMLRVIFRRNQPLDSSTEAAFLCRDVEPHDARRERVVLVGAQDLAALPDDVSPVTERSAAIPDSANV